MITYYTKPMKTPALISTPYLFSKNLLYCHANIYVFHQFYKGENKEFLFAVQDDIVLSKGSPLKRKNLLLKEQILSFKS